MRCTLLTIVACLFCSPIFAQKIADTPCIKIKSSTDTSSPVKIHIRDAVAVEPLLYYLNGKQIDLNKYFLTASSIEKVEVVNKQHSKVFITTKKDVKLLSLTDLLKLHNIDYNELDASLVYINGKQMLDTTILIDSKAKVSPLRSTSHTIGVVGVEIYTDENVTPKN